VLRFALLPAAFVRLVVTALERLVPFGAFLAFAALLETVVFVRVRLAPTFAAFLAFAALFDAFGAFDAFPVFFDAFGVSDAVGGSSSGGVLTALVPGSDGVISRVTPSLDSWAIHGGIGLRLRSFREATIGSVCLFRSLAKSSGDSRPANV
jgi:hypothetical protein